MGGTASLVREALNADLGAVRLGLRSGEGGAGNRDVNSNRDDLGLVILFDLEIDQPIRMFKGMQIASCRVFAKGGEIDLRPTTYLVVHLERQGARGGVPPEAGGLGWHRWRLPGGRVPS